VSFPRPACTATNEVFIFSTGISPLTAKLLYSSMVDPLLFRMYIPDLIYFPGANSLDIAKTGCLFSVNFCCGLVVPYDK
jgi:hypothetical protein